MLTESGCDGKVVQMGYEQLASVLNTDYSMLFTAVATAEGVCVAVKKGSLPRCVLQIEMCRAFRKQYTVTTVPEYGVICIK